MSVKGVIDLNVTTVCMLTLLLHLTSRNLQAPCVYVFVILSPRLGQIAGPGYVSGRIFWTGLLSGLSFTKGKVP